MNYKEQSKKFWKNVGDAFDNTWDKIAFWNKGKEPEPLLDVSVVGDITMIKHQVIDYAPEIKRKESLLITSVIAALGLVLGASYCTYLVGEACEEYFLKGSG